MELRRYLRAVARRWKLVAFVMLMTLVFTAFIVSRETAVYDSSGTYLVKPRTDTGDAVQATDALNRGAEINATYARIARSDVVRERAKAVLEDQGISSSGLRVRSEVLPGTNIIRIGATGPDPDRVAAYAAAIGQETTAYLNETGEVFQLEGIDIPETPDAAEPSDRVFTIAVGVAFGLLAGAALAFTAEYLDERPDKSAMNIRDPMTGAYTSDYFRLRLRQEMSRCDTPATLPARPGATQTKTKRKGKKGKPPPRQQAARLFTVAMVSVHAGDPSLNGSGPAPLPLQLRDAAQSLQSKLRFQDVIAYVGGAQFAVLCPDLPIERADQILQEWNNRLRRDSGDAHGSDVYAAVHLFECDARGVLGDEAAAKEAYDV